jgi:hypothetical protein
MSEAVLELGQGRFGVLHGAERPGPWVFVLLNAGAVHRQGPFRLYVHLARQLSAVGIRCFRFDQAGIGDAVLAAERPQLEGLGEVLDTLQQRTGCEGFVVGGICSAADAAWQLARRDTRVRGLLLLDPVAYGGSWFRLGRLLRPRSPRQWLSALRRGLMRQGGDAGAATVESDYREWPSPEEAADQLAQFCARGVDVLALYTGGVAHYFLHRGQFGATFGAAARDPRVRFDYWPEVDHLFYRPADRDRLIQHIRTWSLARFSPGAAVRPSEASHA